ncbi:unnamed protein product [Withania somnifera]
MLKWLSKFTNEDNLLWTDAITAKYGMEDKWKTNMVTNPYDYTVWRAIRNIWILIHPNVKSQGGGLGLQLRRNLKDWELEIIASFHNTMAEFNNLNMEENIFVEWVKPRNITNLLNCWNMVGNAAKKEERWKIVPACIWWIVWKERNRRCFEDKQSSLQEFKMNGLSLYYFWCKQKILAQTKEIFDVIDYS